MGISRENPFMQNLCTGCWIWENIVLLLRTNSHTTIALRSQKLKSNALSFITLTGHHSSPSYHRWMIQHVVHPLWRGRLGRCQLGRSREMLSSWWSSRSLLSCPHQLPINKPILVYCPASCKYWPLGPNRIPGFLVMKSRDFSGSARRVKSDFLRSVRTFRHGPWRSKYSHSGDTFENTL